MHKSIDKNTFGSHIWFLSKRRGFIWKLLKQDENSDKALYRVKSLTQDKVVFYEVWRIRWRPERIIDGRKLACSQRFPSDDDFGKHAWSFYQLEDAASCLLEGGPVE